MTLKLSTQAHTVLLNMGTSRLGTPARGSDAVMAELRGLGLVGPLGGLTSSGTIARDRIVDAAYSVFDN
jgi:hypothetical protein